MKLQISQSSKQWLSVGRRNNKLLYIMIPVRTEQEDYMSERLRLWIAAALLLLTVFPAAALETSPIQGGWTTGAPMPTSRSELASAILDGQIYVAGGIGQNWTTRAEVERYNIAADSWETIAPLPLD
jgi:hypothetical protein